MSFNYNIKISGSAPSLYPTNIYFGLLWYNDDEALEIPVRYPFQGEWGEILSNMILLREEYPMPSTLSLIYLSFVEQKFYGIEADLPKDLLEEIWKLTDNITKEPLFSHIVVGMAPFGGIAVWVRGFNKSVLVDWLKGSEIEVAMADFHPVNPNTTLQEYCDFYIYSDSIVKENLDTNGLPPRNLFDKYMQQFTYRYQPLFEKWDDGEEVKWQKYREDELKPRFEYIEESLFDGTFDKLHDDGLQKYHEAGKPKKLAIKWHIKKTEYTTYFWFEDENICSIFERFYGAHPDTKTDFIIRIDAEKKKYELALFRQGLKEPQIITEDAYQLLVFKNKFEDYRSDNYNQERGAWIW